jgi:uncharacterized protein
MTSAYRTPAWLPGSHFQTIYPTLVRRHDVPLRRERLETPDGDFVDLDWLDAPSDQTSGSPLVVLFHGLEGNSSSHYARSLLRHLGAIGWRGVVPHFRGCSGELNRRPRAYHSGDHAEVAWMLERIHARLPDATLYAAGVSLGGSALLNWLGREESRAAQILAAAASVSAPIDLTAAGIAIGQGLNRIYTLHFLQTLKPKALAMAQRFPDKLDGRAIRRAASMREFDDAVTGPLHGFDSAQDYWRRASSMPWLKSIAVPTLILNALNDPFIPASSLPGSNDVSRAVVLEKPSAGGHAGFLSTPFPGHLDWLPQRLVSFFREHPT